MRRELFIQEADLSQDPRVLVVLSEERWLFRNNVGQATVAKAHREAKAC